MRICFISDVHANLFALDSVLKKSRSLNIDEYVCLGDIVGYGPHPRECIEVLSNIENMIFVRGNHDHAVGHKELEFGANRIANISTNWTISQLTTEHRKWLQHLPIKKFFSNWMIVHGAPRDPKGMYGYVYEMTYEDNLKVAHENNWQYVFYGHTHIPFIHVREKNGTCVKIPPMKLDLKDSSKTFLINPGSVGQPRDGNPEAAFGTWDQETQIFEFYQVHYDIEKTISAIHENSLPEDLASRLVIGR